MDDTEQYLNNILEKRLGSIPSFSKYGNTITRIPKKQQKLQQMPTVFRKKHETIYTPPSQYETQLQTPPNAQFKSKKLTENQRVQYMVISKRLQGKEDEVSTKTVDVSQYRKSQAPTMVEEENLKRKERLMQIIRDDESEQQSLQMEKNKQRQEERPRRKRIFAKSKEKQ